MNPKEFERKLRELGVRRKRSPRIYGKPTRYPEITRAIILPRQTCGGRKDPEACGATHFHQWGVTQKKWFSRCFTCRKTYRNVLRNGDAL